MRGTGTAPYFLFEDDGKESIVENPAAQAQGGAGIQAAQFLVDNDVNVLITGPSIPKMFGIHQKAASSEKGIEPVQTKTGIRIMSLNLLLEHDSDPVIWRGFPSFRKWLLPVTGSNRIHRCGMAE